MAPGIDQSWIDGGRQDYDNPEKGLQGEGIEFCKCRQEKEDTHCLLSTTAKGLSQTRKRKADMHLPRNQGTKE